MTPDLPDLLKGKMAKKAAILRAQKFRGRIISENRPIINQTKAIQVVNLPVTGSAS